MTGVLEYLVGQELLPVEASSAKSWTPRTLFPFILYGFIILLALSSDEIKIGFRGKA